MINKFVVIDLETTGNVPKKGDKIIQFAAVVIKDGIITEKFSSLINPNKKIPAFIEELTGLNNEMVKDAPPFSEIASKVKDLLENAFFVAHNVHFDLGFLHEELHAVGLEGFTGPILDTVELARILYPTADGYKLSDLAEKENLVHERPHQADSDALVTAELFLRLHQKLFSLPIKTLQQFEKLSVGLKSNLKLLVTAILNEKMQHEEVLPVDVENFHNLSLRKFVKPEENEKESLEVEFPVNEHEKIEMMSHVFPSFEIKKGQHEMMDKVYSSFQSQHHTLIEAGTGVGKSIAYLLPAAYFARQTGKCVVVSTHTIQLQEQLLSREIPLMNAILPFAVTSVLLKGRSHYLSLEKFVQTLKEENDNYDTILTKMQILVWLIETETGDRDELNLSSGGMIYWNKIKGDQTVFLQNKAWGERDFYKRAKNAAQSADLIITNHAMLLSDLSLKTPILPHFEYAVIDEGHHLEKAAGRFLGYTLDYLSIRLILGQFGTYETRQLFYKMEQIMVAHFAGNLDVIHTFELNQIITDLYFEADEFFKIAAMVSKKETTVWKNSSVRLKTRFNPSLKSKETTALAISGERFAFLLKDLIIAVNARLDLIQNDKNHLTSEQKGNMEEMVSFLTDVEDLRESVYELILKPSSLVKWIELDTRSPQNSTTIYAQPATVGEALNRRFFEQKKSVVITSATLTVKHSFDYMLFELGLDRERVELLKIDSPFDYFNQVQLLISDDLPDIKSVPTEEYVTAMTEHLISIAEAAQGRMLILFTAQEMLKKTYELMKESGFLDEFAIIAQGITSGSRSRLTRNFKRYDKAILLGTSSFWEGVDIPGEDLSCLVIVRLPFSSPEEPLTQAKNELITQKGGNPFSEYALPEAILRFKQGFGRLIRTEKDRGVVVIFDKRILTSSYGKDFLQSIPKVPMQKGAIDLLVKKIQTWL